MRRKQITGADLLSELHSYNGNDKRYSESKVTEAAKAVDNGNSSRICNEKIESPLWCRR